MSDKYSAGFLGSPSILISGSSQELVDPGVSFHKFSFYNHQECTISINGSEPIFLVAKQGFSSDRHDKLISSFIINESGVPFNWIGAIKYVTITK